MEGPGAGEGRGGEGGDWVFFLNKKRSISIQDIISCCYNHISLCNIFSIMMFLVDTFGDISLYIIIYHVSISCPYIIKNAT